MKKRICTLVVVCAVVGSHAAFAQSPTYGPIQPDEDLWDIAHRVHPQTDVTRDQVILALLKSNPRAVSVPCNANSVLKQGAVLTIPSLDEVRAIGAADAEREYSRQIEEWKQYRESGRPIQCPAPTHATEAATAKSGRVGNAETAGTSAEPAVTLVSDTAPDERTDVTATSGSLSVATSESPELTAGEGGGALAQDTASQVDASQPEPSPRPGPMVDNAATGSQQASATAAPIKTVSSTDVSVEDTGSEPADGTAVSPETDHSRRPIQWAEMWNENSLLYVMTMSLIVVVVFISGRLIRPK